MTTLATTSPAPRARRPALPERHRSALQPREARTLFRRDGILLVREALPRPIADALRRLAAELLIERDERVRDGHLSPQARPVVDDNVPFHWLEQGSEGRDLSAALVPLVAGLGTTALGGPLQLLRRSVFRRQLPRPVASHTPFHQDASFLRSEGSVGIAWLALDACGHDAPGLELIRGRQERLLPFAPGGRARGNYGAIETDPAEIATRFASDAFWRPHFEPGDLCLMDDHTLHRTTFAATMTRARHALILRFARGPDPAR